MENKKNILTDKSYNFALRIIRMYQQISRKSREYVLSRQILRSGTSIGANVSEANQAESKADFIHKLSIAHKEAFETEYWLNLLRDSRYITTAQAQSLLSDCNEIQKILTASIKTAKRRLAGAK